MDVLSQLSVEVVCGLSEWLAAAILSHPHCGCPKGCWHSGSKAPATGSFFQSQCLVVVLILLVIFGGGEALIVLSLQGCGSRGIILRLQPPMQKRLTDPAWQYALEG